MNTTALEALRNDTRGIESVIHLNNCGAALQPRAVVESIVEHIRLEETVGGYEAAAIAGDKTSRVYQSAAALIDCDPKEIAYCDSASRAWNTLVYSLSIKRGSRIFVSPIEFGSSLIAIQHVAERSGSIVEVLPSDLEGRVLLEGLEKMLEGVPPALIAITHAAAHSGSVNPCQEIGRMARNAGAFYLVDACQSVGQMPVSVDLFQCDALTMTGRKWMRGPRGTGLLYVRKDASAKIDPITSDLVTADYLLHPKSQEGSQLEFRNDAKKFELWERNIAACIGLGVAIDYLLNLTKNDLSVYSRIRELARHIVEAMRELKGVSVWAPLEVESGIVGFEVDGVTSQEVKAACALQAVNISMMSDYDVPLDFARRGLKTSCRVAPHYFNTHEDVEVFLKILHQLIRRSQ